MGLALDPSHWGLLIMTGALIGLGFGLFGRAGELAIAPALLAVLPVCGVPAAAVPKLAAATAVAILIPVTIAHSEGAIRRQAIDWDLFLLLAPSTAVGAVLITTFGDSLSGGLLNLLIIVGIAILALRLFWTSRRPPREIPVPDTPPLIAMTLKAVAGSAGAAAIGVSGGLVVAPILEKHLADERAAATASALTLPFALAATLGYFLSPSPESCGPACGGAIFLPALAATGMAAVLTAPLAAKARQFLPHPTASRLFAVFVVAGACLFALPVQTIPALLASSRDSVLEAMLAPLCDPEPAPAAPAFEDAQEKQGPAAPAAFKDEPPAMTKKWVTAWTASAQGPYEPRDVSADRIGYDIESKDLQSGSLRFIEVKGRVDGADTITVTRNEILTALNKPEAFVLAIVCVSSGFAHPPRYVRPPFKREPDFAATSVTYQLAELLRTAEAPS